MCPCFHGQETPMEEFAFLVSCLVGNMPEEAKDDDKDMSWIPPNLAVKNQRDQKTRQHVHTRQKKTKWCS